MGETRVTKQKGAGGMADFPKSFDREGLLACARGELFGPGNAQLPEPPMLMMDRITDISDDGGAHGKGHVIAEFDINPDLWFFECHIPCNPIMLTGMVRPDRKMLTYKVDFTKAVQTRRLTMGVADGIVEADGDVIYQVKDMKVALSES